MAPWSVQVGFLALASMRDITLRHAKIAVSALALGVVVAGAVYLATTGRSFPFGGIGGLRADPVILHRDAVVPLANNFYDLGSPTSSWRDLYVSGTARFGGAITVGSCTGCGGFSGGANGANAWNVYPTSNNAFDLGFSTSSWRDVFASGTVFSRGFGLAASTSTLSFVIDNARGTSTASDVLGAIRIPWNCVIGHVTLFATSTVASSFRSIVDVSTSATYGTGTTTIFTNQGERPDLGAGQFVSNTVPDVTSLTAGQFLSVDLDQYDSHRGIQVQVACRRTP